jgi:hypothetical protein
MHALALVALVAASAAAATSPEESRRLARAHADAQIEVLKKVPPADPALAAELKSLRQDDQKYREDGMRLWSEKGTDSPEAKALWARQDTLDAKNRSRLESIIATHGWPGVHLAGLAGADAAYLILDHAPTAFQKKYLPRLQAATKAGDVPPMWAAMVEDRVRVSDGLRQRYGTQLLMKPGSKSWELQPIEDEAHIDDRRAAVGFEPLADYLKLFGVTYAPGGNASAPPK